MLGGVSFGGSGLIRGGTAVLIYAIDSIDYYLQMYIYKM